MNGKIAYIWTN